jgi:hypothetical protein
MSFELSKIISKKFQNRQNKGILFRYILTV